jgi:bifunctional DNA primase/polymerase-like protein
MSHDIYTLNGTELVRALQEFGLYPVSGHAVLYRSDGIHCTCSQGAHCARPGKHPVGNGWQLQSREDAVRRLEQFSDWNIGHLTGSISQTVILDVDDGAREMPDGNVVTKNGYATLAELEKRHGRLPPTISWVTGSGTGEQRVFTIPPDIIMPRNSAGRLGEGIDIRGEGGFGVLPPSNHRSRRHYRWKNGLAPGDIAMASLPPSWLEALLTLTPKPPPSIPHCNFSVPASDGDRARAVNRARAYIEEMGPAISGQGGHNHTFNVACRVVERVLDEDDAWAVLVEWNTGCEPPWSERELRHKLDDALQKHALGELKEVNNGRKKTTKPAVNISLVSRLFSNAR